MDTKSNTALLQGDLFGQAVSDDMDLTPYDLILINTSGGKDSSVISFLVSRLAEKQGVKDRIVLVHATFPEEWEGTVDLVKTQAEQLGLPLEVVTRGESLLDYVLRRGMWPSWSARFCTSDFKRGPINKVITRRAPGKDRQARVLNVMGMRAEESPARSKLTPFSQDKRRSNGRRIVDTWLPIHAMLETEVWETIHTNNLPQHPAYAHGMSRLSCCFCPLASRKDLLTAGRYNRRLLKAYVEVEKKIGHLFRHKDPIQGILDEVEAVHGV